MKAIDPSVYPEPDTDRRRREVEPLTDAQLIAALRAENANLREDNSNVESMSSYYRRRIEDLEEIVRASYSDREKVLVAQVKSATEAAREARAMAGAQAGAMKVKETRHKSQIDEIQTLFNGILNGAAGFPPCHHDRAREKCIECLAEWVRLKNRAENKGTPTGPAAIAGAAAGREWAEKLLNPPSPTAQSSAIGRARPLRMSKEDRDAFDGAFSIAARTSIEAREWDALSDGQMKS